MKRATTEVPAGPIHPEYLSTAAAAREAGLPFGRFRYHVYHAHVTGQMVDGRLYFYAPDVAAFRARYERGEFRQVGKPRKPR